MSDPSRVWIQDGRMSNSVPDAVMKQLLTPDAATQARVKKEEIEWSRVPLPEGRPPNATETARFLELLTPIIERQRQGVRALRQGKVDAARVIAEGDQIISSKMQAFQAALDKTGIPTVAVDQLDQLEWLRFVAFVRLVPDASAGLDTSKMSHINHFVERVTEAQLDRLVAALPKLDLDYFCTEQATPKALRRLLASLMRQSPPPNVAAAVTPSLTSTASLVDLIAWCSKHRTATIQMRAELTRLVDDAERLHSLRLAFGASNEELEDTHTQRTQVLIDFVKDNLLPLLAHTTQLAATAHTSLTRAVLTLMPNDDLPE
jgi:hypothetical protein